MLPKAQTLEEIESALLHKPKVFTAEELERQFIGESPIRPSSTAIPNGHRVPPAQFNIPPPNIGSPQTRQPVSVHTINISAVLTCLSFPGLDKSYSLTSGTSDFHGRTSD